MGFFDKFKSNKEPKAAFPWIPITDISELDAIKEASKTKPQAIFKHSTRCGISSMVIRKFESTANFTVDEVDAYYLDLLNYRPISMAIQDKFGVMHQSPQLIILKNGKVVHHASHHDIDGLIKK